MEVLAVTYHLNETRTKSVTVGHDIHSNFDPFIWIYKVGTQRIKLTPEAWMELMNLKDEADTHFHQETYQFLTLAITTPLQCLSWKVMETDFCAWNSLSGR